MPDLSKQGISRDSGNNFRVPEKALVVGRFSFDVSCHFWLFLLGTPRNNFF